jgi:selenide,water dikinase
MELATSGVIPGGTKDNLAFTAPYVTYAETISRTRRLMLNDAQTSGGLLISIRSDKAAELLDRLHDGGVKVTAVIGRVIEKAETVIRVEE